MSWIASVTQISRKPAAKAGTAAPDRRIKKRYPSRRRLACQPMQHDSPAWTGQVIDLSETGLCLELGRRFERGVLLTVLFESEGDEPRSAVVRVMWVKQQSPGAWRMGCQFDQPLSDTEVRELA